MANPRILYVLCFPYLLYLCSSSRALRQKQRGLAYYGCVQVTVSVTASLMTAQSVGAV
jgi:hypothetical protein